VGARVPLICPPWQFLARGFLSGVSVIQAGQSVGRVGVRCVASVSRGKLQALAVSVRVCLSRRVVLSARLSLSNKCPI
jgi:hypothetical protein